MRLRIQRKIQKALRIFGIRGIEPAALPALVRNRTADSRLRVLAARLLALDKRQRDPFGPLYAQMLDCEGLAALDLSNALHHEKSEGPRAEIEAFATVLRTSPDKIPRIAVVQLLGGIGGRASRRLIIETMEREGETLEVRTKAADTLSYQRPRRETVDAFLRCLLHPHPSIRFWAVFGLGSSTADRRAYDNVVTHALRPLVSDSSEEQGYWSVGDEARAMLAYRNRGMNEEVRRECEAIATGGEVSLAKRRWAGNYYWHPGAKEMPVSRSVSYRDITWYPG